MKTFAVAIAAALLALRVSAVGTSLVNGNFNTGDTSGWTLFSPSGETVSVRPADSFSYDNTPYAQIIDFNDSSTAGIFRQEIAITAGTAFDVSLAYRHVHFGATAVAVIYHDGLGGNISTNFALMPYNTSTGQDTGWVEFTTPEWTAPAGTENMSFILEGYSYSESYFDNVSINVVPEPTSFALLGLGGAACLIGRRRKP